MTLKNILNDFYDKIVEKKNQAVIKIKMFLIEYILISIIFFALFFGLNIYAKQLTISTFFDSLVAGSVLGLVMMALKKFDFMGKKKDG